MGIIFCPKKAKNGSYRYVTLANGNDKLEFTIAENTEKQAGIVNGMFYVEEKNVRYLDMFLGVLNPIIIFYYSYLNRNVNLSVQNGAHWYVGVNNQCYDLFQIHVMDAQAGENHRNYNFFPGPKGKSNASKMARIINFIFFIASFL